MTIDRIFGIGHKTHECVNHIHVALIVRPFFFIISTTWPIKKSKKANFQQISLVYMAFKKKSIPVGYNGTGDKTVVELPIEKIRPPGPNVDCPC
jgi:hypothetical protein